MFLMGKYALCCAAVLFLGTAMRAGELDNERSLPKPGKAVPAVVTANQDATAATEMDRESPEQAWRYHGHWGGYRWHGYGWRGGYAMPYYGWSYYRPYYRCCYPYYTAYTYGPYVTAYPY